MNILFITRSQVNSTIGGTERITYSVASILSRKYSVNCYSGYYIETERKKKNPFINEFKINRNNIAGSLEPIIEEHNIEIIICQNEFEAAIKLKKRFDGRVKIIFVHHYRPGWEKEILKKNLSFKSLLKNPNPKNVLVYFLKVPYIVYKLYKLPTLYQNVYNYVDKIVLLSKGFVSLFLNYAGIRNFNENKVEIIPNMLSFREFASSKEISEKKKDVLIVSRMEETQKNISGALRIWESVQQDERFKDWKLDIVGEGPDKKNYEKYVEKNRISGITFHGRKDPLPFYKRASIFLMTSNSEGWGLTLTEAQQNGCVPIAYNTYEAVTDIIEDNKNGFIIEKNNREEYIEKVKYLMSDSGLRMKMASVAVESSYRYSIETVGKKWYNLLNNF